MDSIVRLVFWKTAGADCRFHLGAWHTAQAAHGSTHEFCMEIHAAHGFGEYSRGRALASAWRRSFPLADLLAHRSRTLYPPWPDVVPFKQCWKKNLSICGIEFRDCLRPD